MQEYEADKRALKERMDDKKYVGHSSTLVRKWKLFKDNRFTCVIQVAKVNI